MSKVLNNLITLVEEIQCDSGGINELTHYRTLELCFTIKECSVCAFRRNTKITRRAKSILMENINDYKDASTDSIS